MYQEDDIDNNDKVLSRSATYFVRGREGRIAFGDKVLFRSAFEPLEVEKVESRSAFGPLAFSVRTTSIRRSDY